MGKKYLKKGIAFFAAFIITFSSSVVYAEDNFISDDTNTVIQQGENEKQENKIDEDNPKEKSNGISDENNLQSQIKDQSDNSAESVLEDRNIEETSSEDGDSEEVSSQEVLNIDANYIFENKYDDVNYIFVSVGEETNEVDSVVLKYMHDGIEEEISGETIDNVTAFTIESEYELVSLSGNIDGKRFTSYLGDLDAQNGIEPTNYTEYDPSDIEYQIESEADDDQYEEYIAQANLYDQSDIMEALDNAENMEDRTSVADYYEKDNKIVVIDPGHGPKNGMYTGASRTWDGVAYYEDVINMKIARYLKSELESYGITVYLTRDENSNPTIQERVLYAKEMGADMLVSCHVNANEKESAHGLMAMVAKVGSYNPSNAQSGQAIANSILEELMKLGFGHNYGFYIRLDEDKDPIKYPDGSIADYYGICRYGQLYNVPSIIIEHGFISNHDECIHYFGNENMIQALANADAKGIANYLGLSKDHDTKYGWYNEDGNTYYYGENGPVTGTVIIDGKKYWFDGNGVLQFGWLNWNGMKLYFDKNNGGAAIIGSGIVDGTAYLFNQDGVMYNGSGVRKIDGEYYYMYNGALLAGWYNFNGNVMCFDAENGYKAARGTVIMDGKKYWFDGNGILQLGWLNWAGMKLYFDINNGGGALIGVGTVNGKTLLFNRDGVLYTGTGIVKDDGSYYYLYNDNVLSGWYNFDGKVMCFDKSNGYKAAVGTVIMDGKKYLFDDSGVLQLGWYHWNGMSLYFDINNGGGALIGIGTVEGKTHLFNKDGVMYTGTEVVEDEGNYYYIYNDEVLSGWYNFDGKVMCFDKSNGYKAAVGTVIMGGKKYWFDNKGVLQLGWCHWNGMSLYFDINNGGGALIGPGEVDGVKRLFNEDGVLMLGTGLITVNNTLYYIENGELKSGWVQVNDKKMYFNASNYDVAKGTVIIDNKKYWFDNDGYQETGWFTWMGMRLYFNPKDGGAAVIGKLEMDGYIYTFNSDGVLIGQVSSGVKRTDPVSGRTYTLESTFLTDPQIGTDITEDEFFAAAVYAEGGNQGLAGQTAIALVMLNRVNSSSYADTLSYVIYQKTHFEVARNGALTKYLIAFRDNDQSVLKWIDKAQTMQAIKNAKQIMEDYKTKGKSRQIDGISSEYGVEDFACTYFVTPAAFERQNLDPEKCEIFQYKNIIFFNKWIKKTS